MARVHVLNKYIYKEGEAVVIPGSRFSKHNAEVKRQAQEKPLQQSHHAANFFINLFKYDGSGFPNFYIRKVQPRIRGLRRDSQKVTSILTILGKEDYPAEALLGEDLSKAVVVKMYNHEKNRFVSWNFSVSDAEHEDSLDDLVTGYIATSTKAGLIPMLVVQEGMYKKVLSFLSSLSDKGNKYTVEEH